MRMIPSGQNIHLETRIALLSAFGGVLLGTCGLIGWVCDITIFPHRTPAYHPISPSIAGTLVLLNLCSVGVASRWAHGRGRRVTAILTGLLSGYGFLEVIGYYTHIDLNGEDTLSRILAATWFSSVPPIAPMAGVLVCVSGAALLGLLQSTTMSHITFGSRLRTAAGTLGAITMVGALTIILRYIYGSAIRTDSVITGGTTALGFLLLGLSILAIAGPAQWPRRVFTGPSVHAQLLRVFVPLAAGIVVTSILLIEQMPTTSPHHHLLDSSILAVVFALLVGVVGYRLATKLGRAIERAQKALQESEERFRAFMNNTAAIAWMKDDEGRYVYFSEPYERQFGGQLEEWKGKTAFDLWPRDIAEQFWRNDQVVLHSDRPIEVIEETAAPDGTRSYWQDIKFPFQDASGRRYIGGIGINITTRKQAEEERDRLHTEIEQQRILLDTIVENTVAHLAYLDRDFNFLRVNAAYARSGGRTPEDFIGHNHFEFYPSQEFEAIFRQVRDTGRPYEIRETPFEFPDQPARGVTYWDWTLTPVLNEAGQVTALVLSLIDVTEMVMQRQQLLTTEQARAQLAEQMTAEINHRIKNNLSLLASMLRMQLLSVPSGSVTETLRQLMTRIISLSVVHERLYQEQPGDIELTDMLSRLAQLVTNVFTNEATELTISGDTVYLPSKLGTALAIATNELITNSIKHGGPDASGKRRLDLYISYQDMQLSIRIWNSGNPVSDNLDVRSSGGLGLQFIHGIISEQLAGTFSLRPSEDGTLAEIILDEEGLRRGQQTEHFGDVTD